jgi:hypothetical protein
LKEALRLSPGNAAVIHQIEALQRMQPGKL